MGKIVKAVVAATLLAVGTVGVTAPAQARVSDGVAVLSGLAGLGIGAAIASDHPRHYYREDAYYAPPPPRYYGPPPGYYAPPPPYGYGYVEQCRVFPRWDPYAGRYVEIRRCR